MSTSVLLMYPRGPSISAGFVASRGGTPRAYASCVPETTSIYEARDPTHSILYHLVQDHFETFRALAASLRDGEGLPRFVEREFREFLTCGCLAAGFARFHCDACGHDRLVPFSCKGRGFCSSCGGRRMAERAADLVDYVLPDVPIRQWVLSLPYRLRYLLAWDHDLCRAVVGVYVRAVLAFLRAHARHNGVANGRSGAVVIIQRFGGALNLNVHIHALVIDGVFAHDVEPLRFQAARRLTRDDVAEVVAVVAHRIDRLLQRRGVMAPSEESGGADRWAEEAPVDEHGRLKPIHQMPLEVRRVIESVEVVRRNLTVGDGTQEHVYKVKLISKGRMHELLARHVGLFEPEPPRAAQVPAFVFTDCPGIAVH